MVLIIFQAFIIYETKNGQEVEEVKECADYIICTIPVNVLASNLNIFEPRLPEWKIQAINSFIPIYTEKLLLIVDKALSGSCSKKTLSFVSASESGIGPFTCVLHCHQPVIEIIFQNNNRDLALLDKDTIIAQVLKAIKSSIRQKFTVIFCEYIGKKFKPR